MRILVLAAATLLAACGDNAFDGIVDVGDNDDEANFTATVTGDIQETLSGPATLSLTQQGTGDVAAILLLNDADGGSIRLARVRGGRPGAGIVAVFDHRLGATPPGTEFAATLTTAAGATFVSLGGTVTITSSAPDRLRGGIDFIGRRIFQNGAVIDTMIVNVDGSFDAVPQDVAGGGELP